MAPYILKRIPPHAVYVEPFAGGAAVFFAKEPAAIEVLNDTNREIMTFYKVLQTDFERLQRLVRHTLHARKSHQDAAIVLQYPDLFSPAKIARAVWVQTSMSYGSSIFGSFGYDLQRGSTSKKIQNKKSMFLPELKQRLERVTLESDNAIRIIKRYDSINTFFYLDPPYINCSQGHYAGYTEAHFEELLNTITNLKGKFLLSNYPSEMLNRYSEKYRRARLEIKRRLTVNHKARGNYATEVLTGNYDFETLQRHTLNL